MDRAAATLSGGEAQRIRLATQIGSALVGVLYILDEPSIGLHQRDNAKLIATLKRLRDLGNTVHRGRARRGDDARRRPPRRHGPGRRRARRAGRRPGDRRARSQQVPESLTGQFLSGAPRDRDARPAAHAVSGYIEIRGRLAAQPARHRRHIPLGVLTLRHRRVGVGQVDARQRGPLQGGRQPPAPRAPARPARTSAITGLEQLDKIIAVDQSPIGRTPRSNPATYTGLFDRHPRPVLQDPGGARPRLQAGPLLASTSRAAAARCARATARSRSRCTSCPTSTCPASSATASATTARRWRCASRARPSPTCSRCPSRRRCEFFAAHPDDPPPPADAATTSASATSRLGQPATTLSGGEAQRVKLATELSQGRHRPHALHPRRADHRPALRRHPAAARGARSGWCDAGQHGGRDRAQPRRDQVGRPAHRPRSRGWRRGRAGDRRAAPRSRSPRCRRPIPGGSWPRSCRSGVASPAGAGRRKPRPRAGAGAATGHATPCPADVGIASALSTPGVRRRAAVGAEVALV